ncbi:nitrite reductase small subunit NirD [Bacillus sp. B-jedd]|uniref:nitrite reductase small subunit NirD n=1 Tax=Bacillus sp. B-jedd TaxID=1476857 RepID=UPI0005155F78|nr:nitrite reductase small subunit NirD [Bacillus sp. B-jedd]CEG26408.1 assimilatory nitrite reductase subunit [Bacillus sp. B-jedd]
MAKVKIADYSSLPERIGQVFKIEEQEIVLFRLSNGDVRAVENRSPHPKGGTLADGLVSGEFVFCPVYDLKISLIDGKVQAPDEGEVRTFTIARDGEQVYIEV